MATTTPNYGWDVPTSTDYVAQGAVAIETLGDDIDASLFSITGGKNVGLVHISTTTFSGVSAFAVNGAFTSAFANYRVMVDFSGTGSYTTLNFQFRNGGAVVGGAGSDYYGCMYGYDSSNGLGTLPANALSFAYAGAINTRLLSNLSFDVYNPASASTRSAATIQNTFQSSGGQLSYFVGGLNYTVSAATDGFQIYLPSGAATSGTVRIYGYRSS